MKTMFCVLIVLLFSYCPFCSIACCGQSITDTFYFDKNWSICEKPIALYYRIGTISYEPYLHYTGLVKDYYINDELEMEGAYDTAGLRTGKFTFYYPNGNIKKQGNFIKSSMQDVWSFYKPNASLYLQVNCYNNEYFTPLLAISPLGDTLLKDGNGMFTLDTKYFPDFFTTTKYTITGKVADGRKDSVFSYYTSVMPGKPINTEEYKNDRFISGYSYGSISGKEKTKTPSTLIRFGVPSLDLVDNFEHSNIVFGNDQDATEKLASFLINKETPLIITGAKTIEDTYRSILSIFKYVLQPDAFPSGKVQLGSNDVNLYFKLNETEDSSYLQGNYQTLVALTLDSGGFINNSVFKGNLPKTYVDKINYYLFRLSGLIPFSTHTSLPDTTVNFFILLKKDTVSFFDKNFYVYRGIASYKNDTLQLQAVSADQLMKYLPYNKLPQFKKGEEAWSSYLSTHVNYKVPYQNGAPAGDYQVKIIFTVDENGKISDVHALNDPGYGTAAEAEAAIKYSPNWLPATKDNKPVQFTQMHQIITFQVVR